MLPFTHDQFLDVFQAYNEALWPAAILFWMASAAAAFALLRGGPLATRFVSLLLSLLWGWAGIAYHIAFFRRVNPAAVLFGASFLLQAVLLFWLGAARRVLTPEPTSSAWSRSGVALILYALLYPAVGLLSGLDYPRLPTFGVPCPTAILTIGILLLAPARQARPLSIIPILWSGIGGSAAFLLGIPADLALLVAGGLLLVRVRSLGKHWTEPIEETE